ncbi:MAG TPA: DUF1761 domain-containing protein, partial [Gemmatimonadaceae bacterium]
AKFLINWVWFSPALFLRPWQQLTGVTDEQMQGGMGKAITIWVLGSVLMAFVLVHAVRYAGATTALQGAAVGFFNWLGFVFVFGLEEYGAVKYPFKLVAIKTGSYLVALLVMGAILAAWA